MIHNVRRHLQYTFIIEEENWNGFGTKVSTYELVATKGTVNNYLISYQLMPLPKPIQW